MLLGVCDDSITTTVSTVDDSINRINSCKDNEDWTDKGGFRCIEWGVSIGYANTLVCNQSHLRVIFRHYSDFVWHKLVTPVTSMKWMMITSGPRLTLKNSVLTAQCLVICVSHHLQP